METMPNNELIIFWFFLWFILLYLLPYIFIFKVTSLNPKLAALEGLILNPRLDINGNTVSIDNNYSAFVLGIQLGKYALKHNINVKILKLMCEDAKLGKKYNPQLYLCELKNTNERFFLFMLISSFFPVTMILIRNSSWALNNMTIVILFQMLCSGLVILINILVKYRYLKFKEVFYRTWYDRILNFDLLVINEINKNILKDAKTGENTELAALLAKFTEINTILDENINKSALLIDKKLDEFISLKQNDKLVSYSDTLNALQVGMEKSAELCSSYSQIAENINTSLSGLNDLISIPKTDIQIINKNAALLYELKNNFKNYKDTSTEAEILNLKNVTKSLAFNADSAFTSIETALKKTTENLSASYGRFFEMCEKFSKTYSNSIDSGQIANALGVLIQENKKLEECFNKYSGKFKEKP